MPCDTSSAPLPRAYRRTVMSANPIDRQRGDGLRTQSRCASLAEAVVNTLVGLTIASTFQMLICVVYDIPMTWEHNLIITAWMTVLSVARGYVLRRLWNAEWWKRVKHGNHA